MNNILKITSLCSLLFAGMAWAGAACAQSQVAGAAPAQNNSEDGLNGKDWVAVSNSRLDTMRGGFDFGGGLVASFGIERSVMINGTLVNTINVQIPNIAQMTPAQATALAAATNTVNVIQNGPGNTVDPSSIGTAGSGASVIQNTLNNQNIQSLTTLNATVNTLNTFKNLNIQSTIQNALINSRGF
jgi:hypothetical protein